MKGSRFVALLASQPPLERTQHAELIGRMTRLPEFDLILDNEFACVIGDCDAVFIDEDAEGGVVLGPIFERQGSSRVVEFTEHSATRILRGQGHVLHRDYWGRFVSLFATDRQICVQRDPSGMMPCYYFRYQDMLVVTSDLEICGDLGLLMPRIEWSFIHDHLLADQFCSEKTGLSGVLELAPGGQLTIGSAGLVATQLWSPWTFAALDQQITDAKLATDLLRAAILECVAATAAEFRHVLLGVSGGLDSSIIASAVQQAGASFSCLTMVTDEPIGDERVHARKLARFLDVPLIEELRQLDGVDPRRSHASHLPRPIARCFAQESDRIHLDVAKRLGADAFLGGGGGDSLFCFLQSPAVIADRLLTDGWGAGSWRTLLDICEAARCSVWRAGNRAVRRAYFRKRAFRWPVDTSFIRPWPTDLADVIRSDVWLDVPPDGLPGKAAHIAYVKGMQAHMLGYARERVMPNLWPLMSQPIVELCLRIPSWLWCDGGHNRVIARRAFADLLPDDIVARRTKGAPTGFIIRLFDHYKDVIRTMLLDGCLGEIGILDRPAVERATSGQSPRDTLVISRLLKLVDVEAWARSWMARD